VRRAGDRWIAHFEEDWQGLEPVINRNDAVLRAAVIGDNLALLARFEGRQLRADDNRPMRAREVKASPLAAMVKDNVLYVTWSSGIVLRGDAVIFDVRGRRVTVLPTNGASSGVTMDVTHWLPGVYFVRARLGGEDIVVRVTKSR
jgi:hypothetical protein